MATRSRSRTSQRQATKRTHSAPPEANWARIGVVSIAVVVCLWLMWPPVLLFISLFVSLSALIGGGGWLWQQQQQKQQQQERYEARLNTQFYDLLQKRQGRVSALELAMHTRISGAQARQYLHRQAQFLGAYFERTVHGDIVYIFNPTALYDSAPEMTPAEVAWAYAERERAQYARRYHHAQANAEHLRALHQRSHPQNSTEQNAGQAIERNADQNLVNGQKAIAPARTNTPISALDAQAALTSHPLTSPTNQTENRPEEASATSNVVRGRANKAPHQVITIDVVAVNEQDNRAV
ncbi:MAG: hypothetical protein AAFY72_06540 [Cyanobacteria bacterium J06649_4]